MYCILLLLENVTGKTDRIFSTSFKKYYKCSSNHSYDMDVMLMPPSNATVNATVTSLSVKVYDFKAQAFDFNNKTTGDYGKSKLFVCVCVCVCHLCGTRYGRFF